MGFFKPINNGGYSTMQAIIAGAQSPNYVSASFLKNSDVFTAVKVVSQDIATNPIKLMDNDDNVLSDDLNYLLNIKPNGTMTAWSFKFALTANLLLTGNAYARIYRDKKDKPIELRLIKPSWITIYKDSDDNLMYQVNDEDGHQYELAPDNILHYKYFSSNGIIGLSPLHSLRNEVDVQDAGNQMLMNFFKSGLHSRGALKINKSDLEPEAAKAIKNKFIKSNNDSTGVTVLDSTMDYTQLEVDTSVLKLINSNQYSTKQIAKAFSIPTSKLGIESAHTSVVQENLDYIQNSLDHYFSVFNSENNVKLIDFKDQLKLHFEFDVSRLLKLDTQTNIEESIKMWQNGGISHDEYRKRLGYKPDDNQHNYYVMSNYVPLDEAHLTLKGGDMNAKTGNKSD
jgi:HK97 family phage portal protein